MRESLHCYHNLEWPPPLAQLAGPVAWLRGWVVGKPGFECVDLRVRHDGLTHLGVLGLPRTDLAMHFKSAKSWLPAEFILGVPVCDGSVSLTLEVMDAHGTWRELEEIQLTISPDGLPPPRVEGRIENCPEGTWTVRDAHHPCHGHLDLQGSFPRLDHGRIPVFGWLLNETQSLSSMMATTDTLVFNHLEHSQDDAALAIKVPQHAGACQARLKGFVDYPATLIEPVCLRVYATMPDGTVTLCFAQRLRATVPSQRAESLIGKSPPVTHRHLPKLPSGRPRRVLFVLRALLPDDACLRALDLAHHLIFSHHWAVRLVAMEDGPMRQKFIETDVESLVVDPAGFFASTDERAAQNAMADLNWQIRWDHLDAVAIFDPLCGWALSLAKQRHIPTLFDCSLDQPIQPDPTAIPWVQALLRTSWLSASALCFSSCAVARTQSVALSNLASEVIPLWHTPRLPAKSTNQNQLIAMAPLRTADWLQRHHPEVAARWQFRQGPAVTTDMTHLSRMDEEFNVSALSLSSDWTVQDLNLCLGPLFSRGPLRPIFDALALNIPTVGVKAPSLEEFLAGTRLPLVGEDNPLAMAHALLARDTRSDYLQRETEAAGMRIRTLHSPEKLLPKWETLLNTVAASRG